MRDPNSAKASEIIADLQELVEKYGDLPCVFDDYGLYYCTDVIYVASDKETGKEVGPYQPNEACFLIQ